MNLARIDDNLQEDILNREERIGFFVHSGNYYWIIDWEAHFNLDQAKNIEATFTDPAYRRFIPKNMSINQWRQQQFEGFRKGIPTISFELFPRYRDGPSAKVVSTKTLTNFFWRSDKGDYLKLSTSMEETLSFDRSCSEELIDLRCRLFSMLPKFYVNFDRKIFMHMVRDRAYEGAVLDDWWAAECDFEHMIPINHRYWSRDTNIDLWAVTNFSNYE